MGRLRGSVLTGHGQDHDGGTTSSEEELELGFLFSKDFHHIQESLWMGHQAPTRLMLDTRHQYNRQVPRVKHD